MDDYIGLGSVLGGRGGGDILSETTAKHRPKSV